MQNEKKPTLEDDLSGFALRAVRERIDPETLHVLKRNILDSYAGICASLKDTGMTRIFQRMTSMVADDRGITVWGVGLKAHAPEALFMNTILGRRSDLVNTYMSPDRMGGSHPSDNVSLVLSLAEWLGKGGKDVLSHTWLAYRLSCMFANYYDPESTGYDHDAQALFFTPLVIGSMMSLAAEQMTQAQRIAGMLGLNINQAAVGDVTDWKHCTFASCAMRGLESVIMGLSGFTGPGEIYEGESGVNRFITHAPSIMDTPPDLGSIIFKRWPALVFCQTPIDAAVELSYRIGDHDRIAKVEVQTYKKAITEAAIASSYHPMSRAARTHSLPYCVAAALVKGTVEYGFFDDGFTGNERAVADMIQKIKVTEDEEMTRTFPNGAPCRLIVTLKDGSIVDCFRARPHGDPGDPLEDREIEEKTIAYLSELTHVKHARSLVSRVWELEREPSIAFLVDPLKKWVDEKKN